VLPTTQEGIAIHRFYNASAGAHFYTASEEERVMVQQRWPNVFAYEGVAFYIAQ